MRIKIIVLSLVLAQVTAPLMEGQEVVKRVSLEDCIVGALKNNLGVAVQVLNPRLADLSVGLAKEQFLPSLTFDFNKSETNSPSYSWLEAEDKVTDRTDDYTTRLSQLVPTGGTFSILLYADKTDTSRKFQTINPSYRSWLSFSFSQPLLRDFGLKVTKREIIIASHNLDISEQNFKSSLLGTVYNVEEAYWNLVYAIENLKVKQQSLKLAQDLLAKNKREVEVGMLAPIEILTAESEVATREADILQAEALIQNSEDSLKTIMNLAAEQDINLTEIVPLDTPAYEKKDITIEEALTIGIQNRPDLEASRIDIKSKDVEFSVAKNQLLPDLRFRASYWSPGISGTRIFYLDGNPLTKVIVNTVPGDASQALKDAFGFKYKNWSIGLTLSLPMDTLLSRAQYAQAKVNLKQAKLTLQNQEQQAFLEIRNAVRDVQTNFKRIQAYKAARELAEKKLEAEEKKLKVGLTTNYIVLQHQRDLADARGTELRAIIDYNLSLASLDKALGTTLAKKNIKISEIKASFD